MTVFQRLYRKGAKRYRKLRSGKLFNQLLDDFNRYKYKPGLAKNADWLMFAVIILIAMFGILCIFAATAATSTENPTTLLELLSLNTLHYPGLQLMWVALGVVVMCAMAYLDYHIYAKYAHALYWIQIIILVFVLIASKAGRGGMTAFLNLGNYGVQPSEFGKVIMVIALADLFSKRKAPLKHILEVLPSAGFVLLPAVLVVLQPDFGTMLVYFVIYIVLLWVSGTKSKLIWGVVAVAVALAIPLWYYFNTASDNFRLTRILMWLNPDQYPDDARQVINGQIAIGTGGFWGKGITSVGSFASLGFIPDDHTDFCFAILCEAFGYFGALLLLAAYTFILFRMLYWARKATDKYGEYIITGVFAIFLFHVIENIGMIVGLLPVTGIPLPFISYGGSNCLTNFMAIGLVMNVVMRSKERQLSGHDHYTRQL